MYRRILIGVTGGIAAYKTVDLCRRLIESGHEVRVVMTPAATQFVTPLTFQAVTGNSVALELLDKDAEARALQTAEKLLNLGKRVYLVNLPDKDPSEMGFKAFTELIQQAEELDLSKLMLHKLDL